MKRQPLTHKRFDRRVIGRKLHHAVMALAATASVFGLLLLAGTPPVTTTPQAEVILISTGAGVALDASLEAAIEATDDTEDKTSHRRQPHRSQTFLALPYFSFAQVLRNSRS